VEESTMQEKAGEDIRDSVTPNMQIVATTRSRKMKQPESRTIRKALTSSRECMTPPMLYLEARMKAERSSSVVPGLLFPMIACTAGTGETHNKER
jgi:hypothetical protein